MHAPPPLLEHTSFFEHLTQEPSKYAQNPNITRLFRDFKLHRFVWTATGVKYCRFRRHGSEKPVIMLDSLLLRTIADEFSTREEYTVGCTSDPVDVRRCPTATIRLHHSRINISIMIRKGILESHQQPN